MVSGSVERPPEARLWDWLDGLGVPFRRSMGELLAAYGAADSPSVEGSLDGELPGQRLLPGASGYSFSLQRRWGGDPSLSPHTIYISYRGSGLAPAIDRMAGLVEANLAAIIAVLVQQLGPGCDSSDENRRSWRWDFGAGSVEADCIPEDRQHLLVVHPPYRDDPSALVTCTIAIRSAWEPPLTAEEHDWLKGFTPVVPLGPVKPGQFNRQQPWRRWWPEMGPSLPNGCGPSRDGKAFVAVSDDRFCVLPRETLVTLLRGVEYPVRWEGGVYVQLKHKPPEILPGYPDYVLKLGDWPFDPTIYASEARTLAKALGLRLDEQEHDDV